MRPLCRPVKVFISVVFVTLMVVQTSFARSSIEESRDLDKMGYIISISDCGPYVFHFSERSRKMAVEVERLICESAPDIAEEIGLQDPGRIDVYIVPNRKDYNQLSGSKMPEWGEAFSDLVNRKIVIDARAVLRTPRPLKTVIRHELSHIFLVQKTGGTRCPTWFVEGIAMRQSREWTMSDQWNLMTSIWSGNLPDLEDLGGSFPRSAARASAAYRLSYAAVSRLLETRPEDLVTLLSFARDLGDFDRAFLLTFGETTGDFAEEFHLDLESRYNAAAPVFRSPPFWLMMAGLLILAYVLKKIRNRKRIREWESEEV
ncbi:MAG: hypothetical protein KOO63_03740 [Bacteroidales bacterium]|nr:hypothetical protein [Candidatus Latescibacterota bacterium]